MLKYFSFNNFLEIDIFEIKLKVVEIIQLEIIFKDQILLFQAIFTTLNTVCSTLKIESCKELNTYWKWVKTHKAYFRTLLFCIEYFYGREKQVFDTCMI